MICYVLSQLFMWHKKFDSLAGKILPLHSQIWSWRCCVCWHRCWWPESGRCPLAQSGLPGCSCICKQSTAGDSDTQPGIGRCTDCKHAISNNFNDSCQYKDRNVNNWQCLLTFQRFWCREPHRGFWDSIGSLRNSSSTFHHFGMYGSPPRIHLGLEISRMRMREKRVQIRHKKLPDAPPLHQNTNYKHH